MDEFLSHKLHDTTEYKILDGISDFHSFDDQNVERPENFPSFQETKNAILDAINKLKENGVTSVLKIEDLPQEY